MKVRSLVAAVFLAQFTAAPALAYQMMGKVGEAHIVASKDIVQTAVGSPDHGTLVTAVQAAGLVETLQGKGPFTVFAPTDSAFAKLPEGTVNTLLQPENRAQLSAMLTYHVVPGRIDAKIIANAIEANGGAATFTTVRGDALTFRADDNRVIVEDPRGATVSVAAADLFSSSGIVHVVDGVLLPN